MTGLGLLWAVVPLVLLAKCVEIVAAYLMGTLRLVDWYGFVLVVGCLVVLPGWLWTIEPWTLLALPIPLVGGLMMARSSVRRWRAGSPPPPTGIFVFGAPTPGVANWVRR